MLASILNTFGENMRRLEIQLRISIDGTVTQDHVFFDQAYDVFGDISKIFSGGTIYVHSGHWQGKIEQGVTMTFSTRNLKFNPLDLKEHFYALDNGKKVARIKGVTNVDCKRWEVESSHFKVE